jgi:hypothetical protein
MARQIHGIVENSHNFHHIAWRNAIHDEVPSRTTLAGNMKAAKSRLNFFARGASGYVRPFVESSDRFEKRRPIGLSLPLAKIVFCVVQDEDEVSFRLTTKANPPIRSRQVLPAPESAPSARSLR